MKRIETDIPTPENRHVQEIQNRPLKENKVKSTLCHNPHPYMNDWKKRKREKEREKARKKERKKKSSRSTAVAAAAATPDSSSLPSKRSDLCGLFSPKSCILIPSLRQDQSSKYTLQAPFLSIYHCGREFRCLLRQGSTKIPTTTEPPPPTTTREGISRERDKEKEMKESILCPLQTLT
jgi:predicted AAA+ superfamily ATPase